MYLKMCFNVKETYGHYKKTRKVYLICKIQKELLLQNSISVVL